MNDNPKTLDFQPTLLGLTIHFQDECSGMITDENEAEVFIESDFYTGWMPKPEFFDLLGVEE